VKGHGEKSRSGRTRRGGDRLGSDVFGGQRPPIGFGSAETSSAFDACIACPDWANAPDKRSADPQPGHGSWVKIWDYLGDRLQRRGAVSPRLDLMRERSAATHASL
jgi:hypothetical protein